MQKHEVDDTLLNSATYGGECDSADVWESVACSVSEPSSYLQNVMTKKRSDAELTSSVPGAKCDTEIDPRLLSSTLELHTTGDNPIRTADDYKENLLAKDARSIAKSLAFDGTMTGEEKLNMEVAFRLAEANKCAGDLAKAINQQLKSAGSKFRVALDAREAAIDITSSAWPAKRSVTVLNIDTGLVTDTHAYYAPVRNGDRLPPWRDRLEEPWIVPVPSPRPPRREPSEALQPVKPHPQTVLPPSLWPRPEDAAPILPGPVMTKGKTSFEKK